jgi:dipeptidyl aminopeptidase/acylaminoacyl peptidase
MSDAHDVPRIAWSRTEGHCIVHYRESATADWEVLNDEECYNDKTFSPRFFDGDNTLIVDASYKGHDALFRYDLKTRKLAGEPFLSVDGFDFEGTIETDSIVNKLMGIHYLSDANSTVWFDAKYKDLQAKIDHLLPQTVNKISCGWDCLGASAVLITADSDRQPEQYLIYNIAKESLVSLGSAYPDIKPEQMGLRDFYHYKARDGRFIPTYVTMPPGKSDKPWPAIVLVHGGPWARVWSWEWENEAQFLASRGYIVIQPEFRGSTGFGYEFFHAGWKQWGQSMQDDLADAALWAVKEHGADPKRIGIMGASYGGYATLMGLIKNPEIFRCGVDWAGVTDSNLMFTLAEGDFSNETKKYDLTLLMGDRVADAAMFKQYSPLENAAKLTQPLLMAHGAEDVRVPIAQATTFHDAVTKTNSHVEWVVYNNEYHGWHLEKDNIDFWKRVDAFLDRNLKSAQ